MGIITKPHARREDCDACRDESVHFLCGECGHHWMVTHNGHHDHESDPLDVCWCGSKVEELHRCEAIRHEDFGARPLHVHELPDEIRERIHPTTEQPSDPASVILI